jgi:TRAP-type C4-dicarboxylate transport system substrate-binding protein
MLLGAAALLAGCGGSSRDKAGGTRTGKPVVLTLANFMGDAQELHGFRDEVRRLSGGTLRIDIRNGWRLRQVRYEDGLIGDVRSGKADLGVVGSRAWESVGVSTMRALAAPLLIDSYALQERVVKDPMTRPMLDGLRRLGLVGIGMLPGQLRKPLGATRPLLGPGDYRGLTIGVQQSPTASATMRALGARPVWFGSQAPVDGFGAIESSIGAAQGNRYDRVVRSVTANVDLWPRVLVLFASDATEARLTPAQREILEQAATNDQAAESATVQRIEREGADALCRTGFRFATASATQLAALRRAVQPVYDDLARDPSTRADIARIRALRATVRPEAPPRCAAGSSPAGTSTRLDGVWRMTTKIGDTPSDPEPVPENYGDWIFVLDRGAFGFSQRYQGACTWGYGKYAISGRQMAWSMTDGGGIAPTGAENKPGEFFRFGWSLYRDTLTLTPVRGAISPLNFRGKPWRRVSATPTVRLFAKACPPPAKAFPALAPATPTRGGT